MNAKQTIFSSALEPHMVPEPRVANPSSIHIQYVRACINTINFNKQFTCFSFLYKKYRVKNKTMTNTNKMNMCVGSFKTQVAFANTLKHFHSDLQEFASFLHSNIWFEDQIFQ